MLTTMVRTACSDRAVRNFDFSDPLQDITTDGFGFMLSVGDLVWVPFTYSYTAYYLSTHPKDLGTLGCAGVIAVQLVGYWVFRGANNEKNEFRQGRNPKSAFRAVLAPFCERRNRVLTIRSSSSRPQVFPD